MSNAIAEQFILLIRDTMRNPEFTGNRSALLAAASAFLDAIGPDTGPTADAGRTVANAAMDHGVFGGDGADLQQAAHVLAMHGHLTTMGERIARLEQ